MTKYSEKKQFEQFKKMEFCNYICGLDIEKKKQVLVNLKTEIDRLVDICTEGVSGGAL